MVHDDILLDLTSTVLVCKSIHVDILSVEKKKKKNMINFSVRFIFAELVQASM